jgi:hypothetical protein
MLDKDAKRFWKYVNKTDGCWLWTGACLRGGYGVFWLDGKVRLAHRVAYTEAVGIIPSHLELDHICRTRACVRPSHLEAVPHHVNVLRGEGAAAINARKTHCIRDHRYSGENLYITPGGDRVCRTCHRERTRASRATPEGRERHNRQNREAYATNPAYRERHTRANREWYARTKAENDNAH